MSLSFWQLLLVLALALLFFGRGKLPALAGDMAKAIKNFRAGMKEPDDSPAEPKVINKQDEAGPTETASNSTEADKTRP